MLQAEPASTEPLFLFFLTLFLSFEIVYVFVCQS